MGRDRQSDRPTTEVFLRTGGALGAGLVDRWLDPGQIRPPDRVGDHIRIVEPLGSGGMGEVFRGVDERLGRDVAVKTLHPHLHLTASARRRFVREARILSRLDHPAICRLYDLVEESDQLCLLLELVRGRPLRELAGELSEREVVRICRDIAAALTVAHRDGVIHRDLKPDNVILTPAGEVKILDFGIARMLEDAAADEGSRSEPETAGADEADADATELGMVVGTPRYMSPEQARGEAATPRSDVFNLGLVLCELATGRSPYGEGTVPELLRRSAERDFEVPSTLSPKVRELVQRWTRPEPNDRPTADRCVEELQDILDAPARRRRRWLATAAGVVVVAAVVGAVGWGQRLGAGRFRCQGFERHLDGVWDEATAARVGAGFTAVGLEPTWQALRPVLDRWATDWVRERTDACLATWSRGEQSLELLELEVGCFDRRLKGLEALVRVLDADPERASERAVAAAHDLPVLSACTDARLLTAAVPPPSDVEARARAEALERDLARIKALYDTGQYADGWELATTAAAAARALGHDPLIGEALLLQGLLAEKRGKVEDALAMVTDAAWAAEAGRHDRVVAEARIRQVWIDGVIRTDLERAAVRRAAAEAAVARIGGDAELEGSLVNHLAIVASISGDDELALERCEEAVRLRRAAYGDAHPRIASTLQNCAFISVDLGRLDRALALAEEAFAMRLEVLGPQHPSLFMSYAALAELYDDLGRVDDRRQMMQRALEVAERVFPEGHQNLGLLIANLADYAHFDGRYAEAVDLAREAITILEATVGETAKYSGSAWYRVATASEQLGHWDEALEAGRSALAAFEHLEDGNPTLAANATSVIAAALIELGRPREAVEEIQALLTRDLISRVDAVSVSLLQFRLAQGLVSLGERPDRVEDLLRQVVSAMDGRSERVARELVAESKQHLAERGVAGFSP